MKVFSQTFAGAVSMRNLGKQDAASTSKFVKLFTAKTCPTKYPLQ